MKKRKTVFTAVVMLAGIMAVIDRIRLHNKVEELEERTKNIGRCHNDFCLMQQRYNKSTNEQLAIIQDEIGSVYEHIEKLSDMQEAKCKYADECEEMDCYYEEFAEKTVKELEERTKQDGR